MGSIIEIDIVFIYKCYFLVNHSIILKIFMLLSGLKFLFLPFEKYRYTIYYENDTI